MRHLAPLDKALVLILVPLWAVCFVLGVRMQVEGGGEAPIRLSVADARSYPALTGEFSRRYPSNPLGQTRFGSLLRPCRLQT